MKKLTISSKNITQKQWALFADIQIEASGIKKIIAWGTSNYDSKTDD